MIAAPEIDDYWSAPHADMARLSLAAEVDELEIRSSGDYRTYGVHLTGWGSYRLFAYYCVPRGDGPFPAIAFMPPYGSVISPAPSWARGRYVTISICPRGARHSDVPYRAAFPGAFTENIVDPSRYVYRGVVLDCCRAVQFLLDRREVDPSRVALIGDDLGGALALLTSAIEPWVSAVTVGTPVLCDPRHTVPPVDAYPLGEVGDLLRQDPNLAERVWSTLDHFDPLRFLAQTRGRVLLNRGSLASDMLDRWHAALGGRLDIVDQTGYAHGLARQAWLQRALA